MLEDLTAHDAGGSSALSSLPGHRRTPLSIGDGLSTRDAATLLGISERSVRRAIARGDLPATRQGKAYAIRRTDLARIAQDITPLATPPPIVRLLPAPEMAERAAAIPKPLSSFIGRERDLTNLLALLADPGVRLVTLTGPGGIGKTRLAAAAGAIAQHDFPDGVAFIALESVRQADQVIPAIAQALGLRESASPARLAQVQAFLRPKRALLVLDNVEQILDASPEVALVLEAADQVTALVTSRSPLRINGEREFAVQPLALPGEQATIAEVLDSDAGRLFIERAQAHATAFHLDEATAPVIAGICAQLDGLPLAIELAASRAAVLSPEQLRDRLQRRLPLLTRGPRGSNPRHGAMRDAIAWSYDLLTAEQQRLFHRLAVFAGGFTLEAAEYVGGDGCAVGGQGGIRGDGGESGEMIDSSLLSTPLSPLSAASPPTLDLLADLIEQSLLIGDVGQDGHLRFRMLETIREFGLEQLAASGEEAEVRANHAGAYLAMVRALRPLASIRARHAPIDQLATEQANLRAALEWLEHHGPAAHVVELTAALGMAGYVYAFYDDGQPWLERALARIDEALPTDQARLLIGYAGVLFARGDLDRANSLVTQALTLLQAVDEPLDLAVALILRGAILNSAEEYAAAEEPLRAALAVAARITDPLLRAGVAGRAHGNLSLSARGRHDFARATAHGEAALRLYAGKRLELAEALMLLDLGAIALAAGQPSLAAEHWHDGLTLMEGRGDLRNLADALSSIASLATLRHDDRSALLLFGGADALRDRAGTTMLWPVEITTAERSLTLLRDRVGAQRVTALLSEGRARSLSETVALARAVTADAASGAGEARHILTRREQDVVRLMAAGQTDREIAEAIYVSRRTVSGHVRAILAKLGCASRAEAVARASADGIL